MSLFSLISSASRASTCGGQGWVCSTVTTYITPLSLAVLGGSLSGVGSSEESLVCGDGWSSGKASLVGG